MVGAPSKPSLDQGAHKEATVPVGFGIGQSHPEFGSSLKATLFVGERGLEIRTETPCWVRGIWAVRPTRAK